jgi:hypothetical protein
MSPQERARERDVACLIHKQTYADGRAYRYLISDGDRQLLYVAKRSGLLLPGQTRLTEFFDAEERHLVGRLQPPEVAPWLRAKDYDVYIGEETEVPFAVIHERRRLVDVLLLRVPRYEVQVGEHRYIAEGSRYDTDRCYGIFVLEEEEALPPEEPEAMPDFVLKAEGRKEKATQSEAEEAEAFEGVEDIEALEQILEKDVGRDVEPEREQVGQITCPTAGPSYIVETEAEPLQRTPLVLAALVALIDMERHP